MTDKQITGPKGPVLSLATFPGNIDAGDGKEVTLEQARALIMWSARYGLDAWAGHACYMYHKPYVTEKGALANANHDKRYRGYALGRIPKAQLPEYGYPQEARGWYCEVYIEGYPQPIVDYGIVTDAEIAELELKYGDKAHYLALWRDPSGQAKVRAIRKAHLRAFPLKGYQEGDTGEADGVAEALTGDPVAPPPQET